MTDVVVQSANPSEVLTSKRFADANAEAQTGCFVLSSRFLLNETQAASFLHPLTVMSHYLSALKCSHSPLKSHFHPNAQGTEKHAPSLAFVSPNTLSSVCPDLREHWSLSAPHAAATAAAGNRGAAHRAQAGLVRASGVQSVTLVVFVFVAAACSPSSKLHGRANLLQPAVGAALITAVVPTSVCQSGQRLPTHTNTHTHIHGAVAIAQLQSCTEKK